MLLGRFRDTGEHAGRAITLDDNALAVEVHGPITFAAVADADTRAEVDWEGPAFRTWALNRAVDEGWIAPVAAEPLVAVPVTIEEPQPVAPPRPQPAAAAAAPAPASTREGKAQAKRAAKEAKAAERAAYEAASQARIAAAAAEKAAAKQAKAAAKAEAKRGAGAKVAQGPAVKAERAVKPEAAPSAEKHSREGRKLVSSNVAIVLGVIATLLFAIAVAVSLGKPMERRELPTVKVETPAEAAGTTTSK